MEQESMQTNGTDSMAHVETMPMNNMTVEDVKPEGSWRKVVIVVLLIALLVIVAGLAYRFKDLVVAATVNGNPISRFSVIAQLEKQGGKDALDSLIDQRLIAAEAKKKNVTVTDEDINAEIKTFEDAFTTQGQTLDDALKAENLTREDLRKQIIIREQIKKLLGDKVNVSDDEVTAYIKDNSITLAAGQEEQVKSQVKSELQQQKLSDQSTQLITDLRSAAKINRFVNY